MKTQPSIAIFLIALALTPSALPATAAQRAYAGKGEPALKADTRTAAEERTASDTPADAARLTALKAKADAEIARRTTALEALETRVRSMKRITDGQGSSLKTFIEDQVEELDNLKARINSGTDPAAIRSDVRSITSSYRIFALVLPQGAVIAAGDRALSLADVMTTLGTKLKERIADAKQASKDVTPLEKSLADYTAKLADAKNQAQAAIDAVSKLTPDGGDKTAMAANLAVLKDARAKIQAAQQDFIAARQDARDIVKGLRAFENKLDNSAQNSTNED